MTFTTDLDNLIRHKHGDVKKLREIRDTFRHDNFITTNDKNYVESLINEYLKDQPLEKSSTNRKPDVTIKLQTRSKTSDSHSPSSSTFNFSSSKNMGILGGGAAAVIAIIVLVGFPAMNPSDVTDSSLISTANNPLLITVDQSKYQRADIISISGDTISYNELVTLSIENTNGIKIWKEDVVPKKDGKFSTLVIAGGGGWEDNGSYTLKVIQINLAKEVKFQFVA